MKILKNPARDAIQAMRDAGFTETQVKAQLTLLGLSEKDLPEFQFTGEANGPPVTTLKSETDFSEEAATATGVQTVASRTANQRRKLLDAMKIGGSEIKNR